VREREFVFCETMGLDDIIDMVLKILFFLHESDYEDFTYFSSTPSSKEEEKTSLEGKVIFTSNENSQGL